MKNSKFLLGIVLLVAAAAGATAELDKTEILGKLNFERREFARIRNISNMWKLEWSEDLVEKASSLPKVSRQIKNGPNFRHFFLDRNKDAYNFERDFENWIFKQIDDGDEGRAFQQIRKLEKTYVPRFEMIVPEQRSVGCIPYVKRSIARRGSNYYETEYRILCLIGPLNKFADTPISKGPPASGCVGGVAVNELCQSPPTPSTTHRPSLTTGLVLGDILRGGRTSSSRPKSSERPAKNYETSTVSGTLHPSTEKPEILLAENYARSTVKGTFHPSTGKPEILPVPSSASTLNPETHPSSPTSTPLIDGPTTSDSSQTSSSTISPPSSTVCTEAPSSSSTTCAPRPPTYRPAPTREGPIPPTYRPAPTREAPQDPIYRPAPTREPSGTSVQISGTGPVAPSYAPAPMRETYGPYSPPSNGKTPEPGPLIAPQYAPAPYREGYQSRG